MSENTLGFDSEINLPPPSRSCQDKLDRLTVRMQHQIKKYEDELASLRSGGYHNPVTFSREEQISRTDLCLHFCQTILIEIDVLPLKNFQLFKLGPDGTVEEIDD